MTAIAKHLERGHAAEQQALAHLQQQGLQLLAQNWRCRGGELDLVMLDGDTVVFVEVRYRTHAAWGGALESIDSRKQQRLILAAGLFLQQQRRWNSRPCRFDVITLHPHTGLQWLRDAFQA